MIIVIWPKSNGMVSWCCSVSIFHSPFRLRSVPFLAIVLKCISADTRTDNRKNPTEMLTSFWLRKEREEIVSDLLVHQNTQRRTLLLRPSDLDHMSLFETNLEMASAGDPHSVEGCWCASAFAYFVNLYFANLYFANLSYSWWWQELLLEKSQFAPRRACIARQSRTLYRDWRMISMSFDQMISTEEWRRLQDLSRESKIWIGLKL
jgi:hypothetical protein